jgi:hypothetical protein
MLQFSADAFAKHAPGIQNRGACAGNQEKNCRVNDKGVQNAHGVWFIPGGGRGSQVGKNPPGEFWNMKCAPRARGQPSQFCDGKLV